jgi:hypothetical protein
MQPQRMNMLSVVVGERAVNGSQKQGCAQSAELFSTVMRRHSLVVAVSRRARPERMRAGSPVAKTQHYALFALAQLHAKPVFSSSNQETHYIALADASDECNTSIKRRSTGSNMLLVRGRAK